MRSSTPKPTEQKSCARAPSSDHRVSPSLLVFNLSIFFQRKDTERRVFPQPRSDRDMENEAAGLRRKLSVVREENSSLVLENRQLIGDLEAAQLEIASSKSKVPHHLPD